MNKKTVKKFVKDHKYKLMGLGMAAGAVLGKNMIKTALKLSPTFREYAQFYISKAARDIIPIALGEEVHILVRKYLTESETARDTIIEFPQKICYVRKVWC